MVAIIYFSMFVSNLFDGIIARQYLLFTGIFTLIAGIIDEIFEGGETYSRRYF
jgi:phosphatidylglycerophosphate synthase